MTSPIHSVTADDPERLEAGVTPAVLVRGVSHHFGEGETRKQVLQDNSVTLMPGEMAIMTGPSGSGKSTLLTLIGGLRRVQEGRIEVLGRELSGLTEAELTRVRRSIGFIFQAHNLFDSLTALQNVRTALEHDGSPADGDRRAMEVLDRLGLGGRLHYKPQNLSGGQRQRVAIARALVHRPQVVLADEPTAALDKVSGREVINVLRELATSEGTTILLVTHDSRILDVADRVINMIDGRIASEIFVEETVRVIEFLRRCAMFENSPAATLTETAQKMVPQRYTSGSIIVREGEQGDTFYVIRKGQVEVRRERSGVPTAIATLSSGDFFGEVALLGEGTRNATVVAMTDTVLYGLRKEDFLAALAASPSLNEQLREVFFRRG